MSKEKGEFHALAEGYRYAAIALLGMFGMFFSQETKPGTWARKNKQKLKSKNH